MLGWLTGALMWTFDPDVVMFGGPSSALLQADTLLFTVPYAKTAPRASPTCGVCRVSDRRVPHSAPWRSVNVPSSRSRHCLGRHVPRPLGGRLLT